MTRVHGTFVLMVAILISIPLVQLFATLPGMVVTIQQVMPQEARSGDLVVATGMSLGASHILELYLVDNNQVSYRVEIVEQMDAALRFRVPAKLPPGEMRLAVKVLGQAMLIEQPATLRIL